MSKNLISLNPVLKFKLGKVILKFLNGGLQPWAGYYTVGNWPRSTRKINANSNNLNKISSLAEYIKKVKSGQINPRESITFIPPVFKPISFKPISATTDNEYFNNGKSKILPKGTDTVNRTNKQQIQPKSPIRKIKTALLWELDYKNIFNRLTPSLIEYLDSLGIDMSNARTMLEGLNKNGANLVVDNKFGTQSESALINILANMPKNFKSPVPLPPIYYNSSGELLYDNDSAFLRRGGHLISRNPVTRFKKEKINKLLK